MLGVDGLLSPLEGQPNIPKEALMAAGKLLGRNGEGRGEGTNALVVCRVTIRVLLVHRVVRMCLPG